jgi:hypothetical protein
MKKNISLNIAILILSFCLTNCKTNKNLVQQDDPVYSERIGRFPNKTLVDTFFADGDIIKIPEIAFVNCTNCNINHDSLKIIADFIKLHPKLHFEIGSHVDARGSADKNLDFTLKRATSIKEYLVKTFSVNSDQLTCKGYGETQPITPDTDIKKALTNEEKESLHATNRRVTLTVTTIK